MQPVVAGDVCRLRLTILPISLVQHLATRLREFSCAAMCMAGAKVAEAATLAHSELQA